MAAEALIQEVLPSTGSGIRVGITGSPGVGKSSFIEALGLHLLGEGRRVAVLAVDPSSPVAGGSILADKTRMERLTQDARAFIRPSPAGDALGGVAQRTRESMLLCEAAGFDVVLVETVGVGQSEHRVRQMVDFFLVLLLPGAGDELQGIKKGVIELADAIVIHKADGDQRLLAEDTCAHYDSALRLLHKEGFWSPQVRLCSSLEGHGVSEIWQMVCEFRQLAEAGGELGRRRGLQNLAWMQQMMVELWQARLAGCTQIRTLRETLERQVLSGEISAQAAAKKLVQASL